jgi:hypothetical protein
LFFLLAAVTVHKKYRIKLKLPLPQLPLVTGVGFAVTKWSAGTALILNSSACMTVLLMAVI